MSCKTHCEDQTSKKQFLLYLGAFSCFCPCPPNIPYSGMYTIYTVVPGTFALTCTIRSGLSMCIPKSLHITQVPPPMCPGLALAPQLPLQPLPEGCTCCTLSRRPDVNVLLELTLASGHLPWSYSYKRVKGRSHTAEERTSMHSHRPHATSQQAITDTATCHGGQRLPGPFGAWRARPRGPYSTQIPLISLLDSTMHDSTMPVCVQTRKRRCFALLKAPNLCVLRDTL